MRFVSSRDTALIVQCDAFVPAISELEGPHASRYRTAPPKLENLGIFKQAPSLQLFLRATIMAERRSQAQRPLPTQEQLKKKLEITNFDPNAILRGAQLTVVGG